jgi:hypothetical protein
MERRVDRSRLRIRAVAEWLIAGALSMAMLTAASAVVRTVSVVLPAISRETPAPAPVPPIPAGIPSRAVSVPVLLLPDGKQLRVGETVSSVGQLMGTGADMAPPALEHGTNGARITRFYKRAGTRFVLVFEPFEQEAEARVAAIYLP